MCSYPAIQILLLISETLDQKSKNHCHREAKEAFSTCYPSTYKLLSPHPDANKTTMSGGFKKFQSLPWELQIMIFEEFLLDHGPEKPRVVVLGMEEIPDPEGFDWRLKVENREQLKAENADILATGFLGVCSSSRAVARRHLARPVETPHPPRYDPALMGLDLSFSRDLFWIPSEGLGFDEGDLCTPYVPDMISHYGNEQDNIEHIMLDVRMFEIILRSANQWVRDHGDADGLRLGLNFRVDMVDEGESSLGPTVRVGLTMYTNRDDWSRPKLDWIVEDLLMCFLGLKKLILAVDIPRKHVPWDQIQIVRPDDPKLLTLAGEARRDRCLTVSQEYETRRNSREASDGYGSDFYDRDNDSDSEGGFSDDSEPESESELRINRWPQLSFAFLTPSSEPMLSTETVS